LSHCVCQAAIAVASVGQALIERELPPWPTRRGGDVMLASGRRIIPPATDDVRLGIVMKAVETASSSLL